MATATATIKKRNASQVVRSSCGGVVRPGIAGRIVVIAMGSDVEEWSGGGAQPPIQAASGADDLSSQPIDAVQMPEGNGSAGGRGHPAAPGGARRQRGPRSPAGEPGALRAGVMPGWRRRLDGRQIEARHGSPQGDLARFAAWGSGPLDQLSERISRDIRRHAGGRRGRQRGSQ